MPMDMDDHEAVCNRLAKDAKQDRKRWEDLQAFKACMAMLQPIYAITLHGSQGSTFGRVFVDVPSIMWRAKTKLLEAQQLAYVGLTRPTTAAMLIGV
jgi:folate-dependent tRNA-U54 methylase TrmFO/GidA